MKMVQIQTGDGLTLPGLLFEAINSKKVVIRLHGNGSSSVFYHNYLHEEQAKILNDRGISFLSFNNRGAHYIKKLTVEKNNKVEKKRFGMAYEKIKDCIKDIDAAIKFLESLGYKKFYLLGESTGANKICVYHYYKPKNKVSKYILIGGGDDMGIYYDLLGKNRFFKLLKESKARIRQGKGEDLIKDLLPNELFSYQAFYDIANPDGDYNVFPFLEAIKGIKLSRKPLFRYFKSVNKPTLIVYGENDEYSWNMVSKCVETLKKQKPELEYHIIKGADHSLTEHQKQLSELIVNWL